MSIRASILMREHTAGCTTFGSECTVENAVDTHTHDGLLRAAARCGRRRALIERVQCKRYRPR